MQIIRKIDVLKQDMTKYQGPLIRSSLNRRPSLHDIQLEVNNLVNSDNLSDSRVATAKAQGQTAEQGTISLNAKLNPSTQNPTFDVDIQADNVGLVNFKNLLDTYAPFDLEAGTLTLAAEVASNEGRVKGYIKPILQNVEVFSWKGDIERDGDGFIEGSIEAISAFITELFENQSEDQIATRIPIEGDLSNPDTQTWEAFVAILKNAFVKAFKGDAMGNLIYRMAGRNFNPLMAMAAKHTIVQVNHVVELGALDPETIVTPGIFVNSVVEVSNPQQEEILNREGAYYPPLNAPLSNNEAGA